MPRSPHYDFECLAALHARGFALLHREVHVCTRHLRLHAPVYSGDPGEHSMLGGSVASGAVLYHFDVELSDVARGVYSTLDVRVALHPSEDTERLLARCLAYCLLYEEDLSFGRGLSEADDPALWLKDGGDRILHWVDVGTPTADRMHRASKRAMRMTIVSHKGADGLRRERDKKKIHGAENITVVLLDAGFVQQVAAVLERTGSWVLVRNDGELHLTLGGQTFAGSVEETSLADL